MKSADPAVRRALLREAYLGHRLDRTQLGSLLSEVEAPAQQWNDRFESLTSSRVEAGTDSGPLSPIEDLGLFEKYGQLNDDKVWSAEQRAIQRHLSKLDSSRFESPKAKHPSNSNFVNVAQDGFEDWDRDHNGVLDHNELDFAMSGGFYGRNRESADTPETGAVLAILRKNLDYLQSANPHDGSGVSKNDLLLLKEPKSDLLQKMKTMIGEDYQDYLEKAQLLVERKPLHQENISPRAIRQGVVGSCVLLSTLAGVPEDALRKMLQTNPDGSFQVTFADGATEHVQEPTLAERLYHAKGDSLERWPALFELAMAQRLYHQDQPEDSALRTAIDGIAPEKALKAIVNTEADKRSLDELSVNQTREALRELTKGDGPVICGSRPAARGDFISIEELDNGIQNGHCYTVLGFESKSDTVTLRNPWGRKEWVYQDSPDDGVFEMPIRDFYTSFRWVAGTNPSPG